MAARAPRTPNPRFRTPAGKFRGNPTKAKYNKFGLQCIVVSPTRSDATWVFSDTPCTDEFEYMDMLHAAMGVRDRRTAQQRLEDSITVAGASGSGTSSSSSCASSGCVSGSASSFACFDSTDSINYDSHEIGIECFSDGRWPERTDLRCWWCLHGFDTRPFPCPFRRDREGMYHVLGVFCGPSCAKAWARRDANFVDLQDVYFHIDTLAKMRGFCKEGQKYFVCQPAPPRQCLEMFRGQGHGLTIEQFRGLCACGFDVTLLNPPFITHKQVIVGDCDRQIRAQKSGRICHVENVKSMSLSAMEAARQRKQGLEIFAGIGARRLKDFLDPSKAPAAAAATAAAAAAATSGATPAAAAAAGTGPAVAAAPAAPVAVGATPTGPRPAAPAKRPPPPDPFDSMMRAGYAVKPRQVTRGVPPQLKKRKY